MDFDGSRELARRGLHAAPEQLQYRFAPERLWYAVGVRCVQWGLPLHPIGPSRHPLGAGERRVRLHGHALRGDGSWLLYW